MSTKQKFAEGERVLCYHGPLLYDAKLIKSEFRDDEMNHFVHYSGWNKHWDEWVEESRVRKFNEENLKILRELEMEHGVSVLKTDEYPLMFRPEKSEKKKSRRRKEGAEDSPTPPPEEQHRRGQEKGARKQKAAEVPTPPSSSTSMESLPGSQQRRQRTRTEQSATDADEEPLQLTRIVVPTPEECKLWLVDDWDLVNTQRKLLKLPCDHTVDDILAEYLKVHLSAKDLTLNRKCQLQELMKGIRAYFNAMLRRFLLYPPEVSQYDELMEDNPDAVPSKFYGGVHLVRCLAKFGYAFSFTPTEPDVVMSLNGLLMHFMRYLPKCSLRIFDAEGYEPAPAEYLKNSV